MSLTEINAFLNQCEHDWSVETHGESLSITNADGLTAIMVKSDSQILIETLLFPVSTVIDQAEFDNAIMYEQKALPLSGVAKTVVDQQPYYCAFGALSSKSIYENIALEVEVLFQNVQTILHFSHDFLNVSSH
ncbi:YjfI family protein [Vibrio sp. S4M6]|uniref:DUF2170 family protein n=1 Tax=Vibrio sinus TaxID=2946865 RepID=UPI00202A0400|nr:DUF2170 family protein [Vibrio sinus]MCL9781715.1 YjfI family protein [Vibrio sinus]